MLVGVIVKATKGEWIPEESATGCRSLLSVKPWEVLSIPQGYCLRTEQVSLGNVLSHHRQDLLVYPACS